MKMILVELMYKTYVKNYLCLFLCKISSHSFTLAISKKIFYNDHLKGRQIK